MLQHSHFPRIHVSLTSFWSCFCCLFRFILCFLFFLFRFALSSAVFERQKSFANIKYHVIYLIFAMNEEYFCENRNPWWEFSLVSKKHFHRYKMIKPNEISRRLFVLLLFNNANVKHIEKQFFFPSIVEFVLLFSMW